MEVRQAGGGAAGGSKLGAVQAGKAGRQAGHGASGAGRVVVHGRRASMGGVGRRRQVSAPALLFSALFSLCSPFSTPMSPRPGRREVGPGHHMAWQAGQAKARHGKKANGNVSPVHHHH